MVSPSRKAYNQNKMHYRKANPNDGKSYQDRLKEKYGKMTPSELEEKGMSLYCVDKTTTIIKNP
jgi:hypothetical protein